MRLLLGDVFEINTPKGKIFLHYIYKDKMMGELVRVLPGLFSTVPKDMYPIVFQEEKFMVFFPLSFAYKQRIASKVSHFPTNDYEKPKHMRTEHYLENKFAGWHIVDTETWERHFVKQLTGEQKKLSPWGIWNDTLLVERVTNGWTLDSLT